MLPIYYVCHEIFEALQQNKKKASDMDYPKRLEFLYHSTDQLEDLIRRTKLNAIEYAKVMQTLLNTYDEIRRTTLQYKYDRKNVSNAERSL